MGANAFAARLKGGLAALPPIAWKAARWLGSHVPMWLDHAKPVRIPLLVLAMLWYVLRDKL